MCGIANEVGIRKMPRQRCFAKFLLHSPSPYSKRRHHFVSPINMKTSTIIYVACEMRPRYSRRQIEYIGHRTGYRTALKMSTGITLRLITSFSTSIYIVHDMVTRRPYTSFMIWSFRSPSKSPKCIVLPKFSNTSLTKRGLRIIFKWS